MNAACLITGGAGNLACQLTFALAEQGIGCILCDVAERPRAAVAAGTQYVQADITARDQIGQLLETHRPATVLHFASLLSAQSEQERPLAWQVNVDGAFYLLEEAVRCGVPKVFFPSSVAAYGGPLPCPVPEDFPQWPVGLYGVTKVAVERLGVYYHQRFKLDFRCLRVPVVLSRHATPGAASAYASRAFIEAAQSGKYVFRVRPQARPALVYIKDVLAAMVQLLLAPAAQLTRRVYNVQALSPTAEQLAAAIRDRLPGAVLSFEPEAATADLIESWPVEFDDRSARRDWGWQPAYGLERMADDFIADLQRGR